MKLADICAEYVAFKQSLGMRFDREAHHFKAFCRATGDIDIADVTSSSVLAYISGRGPVTPYWHRKYKTLKEFYRYAISRGHASSSPLPTTVPKQPQPFPPYIYTTEELRRLVRATSMLSSPRSTLQVATFRALLLTLYGAALRISEALSLTCSDVDTATSLLTIRDTKFFKTRLVPIGPRLTTELQAYMRKRRKLPYPSGKDSAFFASSMGKTMSYQHVKECFRKLCDHVGIRREAGTRHQPRLHDIRHAAAVHRLVAWYREGADVQRLLPLLSTYLGHVHIRATQHYLTMTPELLNEANRRFKRYALSEVSHD